MKGPPPFLSSKEKIVDVALWKYVMDSSSKCSLKEAILKERK